MIVEYDAVSRRVRLIKDVEHIVNLQQLATVQVKYELYGLEQHWIKMRLQNWYNLKNLLIGQVECIELEAKPSGNK